MFSWVIVSSLVVAAPGAKDKKAPPIVGDWIVVSIDGQKAIPTLYEFQTDGSLIISTQFGTAESSFRRQYEVTEKAAPARIDITGGGTLSEGIFKIEGERLTICQREGRGQRPKEFGEKGTTQEVFKRVKPKD